jgi:SAM-dependent methyltransferase
VTPVMTTLADVLSAHSDVAETLDACPLCAGTAFEPLPTPGHWIGEGIFFRGRGAFGLQRCRTCSLAFVNPRPTQTLLNTFYDCDDYVCHSPESGNQRTAQFLLECVARYGPYSGRRFLDFGCGGGFLLRAASDDNWNAVGYDVGNRALASCQAQGLAATDNLAGLPPFSFDVVFLNHVFEHLADQQSVLAEVRRLLHKNGKLFVVVPNRSGMRAKLSFPLLSRHFNIDERHRAFPIHLFYFTPQTLSQTLEKNGLRVEAAETFGLGMDEFINRRDNVPGLAGVKTIPTRKQSALKQILKKKFFSAHLGENLLIVAQSA